MKETVSFLVSVSSECGFITSHMPVEVVCVYGKPTADPDATTEIPFRIKEVCANGKPLDWSLKEYFLKAIGGEETLEKMVMSRRYES